jgi:hypothetical protein
MSRQVFSTSIILAGALAVTLGAQATQEQLPQKPADPALAPAVVTIEGCLQLEADVPGRTSTAAARPGAPEEFVVTAVKIIKGDLPSEPARADQPVGTSGTQRMYQVKGIENETLKKNAGQRVQIEGTINPNDTTNQPRSQTEQPAGSKDDLPDIQATAIHVIAGPCEGAK